MKFELAYFALLYYRLSVPQARAGEYCRARTGKKSGPSDDKDKDDGLVSHILGRGSG